MKMNNIWLINILLLSVVLKLTAQDSLQKKVSISLQFFTIENNEMYLIANAKAKTDGRFRSVPNLLVKFYLNEANDEMLMDSVITDYEGRAKVYVPPKLKSIWQSANTHTFIATSIENYNFKSGDAELTITKSKLTLDTLIEGDARLIKLTAVYLEEGRWNPIKDLEVKIGVKRLGGMLKVTEEDTYTTDSTGSVVAAFIDTSLVGDRLGNIILEAKVEDHDIYGNLKVSRNAFWGSPAINQNSDFFSTRTLWSTRFKTPYWLLIIVYGMSVGIWGIIIIVIRSLIKTVRLGK